MVLKFVLVETCCKKITSHRFYMDKIKTRVQYTTSISKRMEMVLSSQTA